MHRVVLWLIAAAALAGTACAASPPAAAVGDGLLDAVAEGKISAPVRVQYRLLGDLVPNQPVALRLSVTPRVAGERLLIEVPDAVGYAPLKESRTLVAGKASASIASEATVMLTPTTATARDMQVLVSYDVDGARFFSVYRVPLASTAARGPARQKDPARPPVQQ